MGNEKNDELQAVYELVKSGHNLTADEARELEDGIESQTDDLKSRILLLGYYYWRAKYKTQDLKIARIKHIGWIVSNHPAHPVAGFVEIGMSRGVDRLRDWIDIRTLWKQQIDSNQNNVEVLSNAANFFFLEDKVIAEECLLRAKELDPVSPKWYGRLSHLHHLWGITYERQALSEAEMCSEMLQEPRDVFDMNCNLPELALNADEIEKAVQYSQQLLEMSQQHKDHFTYGRALQGAHTTLGIVALKRGSTSTANEHLLQSLPDKENAARIFLGQPTRRLVSALFDKGERETVLKWLDLCSSFHKVDHWREQVLRGQSPWPYEREERRRYFQLSRLPRTAFNKGQWAEARRAVDAFFKIAQNYADDERHYGFGMHTAHVVLGQLALLSGDMGAAKEHLTQAGRVRAADRLREQGPDIALALDLLKLGEKDAVEKFLEDCKRLWRGSADSELLEQWAADVQADKIPKDWEMLVM